MKNSLLKIGCIVFAIYVIALNIYATSDRPPKYAAKVVEIALENSLECIKKD